MAQENVAWMYEMNIGMDYLGEDDLPNKEGERARKVLTEHERHLKAMFWYK